MKSIKDPSYKNKDIDENLKRIRYTRAKWKFGRIEAGIFSHTEAKFFGIASATAINFNEGMGKKTK